MKRKIVIFIFSTFLLGTGIAIGWWGNSPGFDFLCSPASVYKLGKNIEGEGIFIMAGTKINLRSCEYANRFSVEMYYDKGNHRDIFIPLNSAVNVGNHGAEQYDVNVSEK